MSTETQITKSDKSNKSETDELIKLMKINYSYPDQTSKDIQYDIYNAVKEISEMRGYSLVLDRSSDQGIIFGSPRIDISNEVLLRLGFAK